MHTPTPYYLSLAAVRLFCCSTNRCGEGGPGGRGRAGLRGWGGNAGGRGAEL